MDPILLVGQLAAGIGVAVLAWDLEQPRKSIGLALAVGIMAIGVLAS